VDIGLVEPSRVQVELLGAHLEQGECGLRRFFHDLAELAREDEAASAGGAAGLDEEDVAAVRRPGEAGGDAGHAGAQGHLVFVAAGAQDGVEIGDVDVALAGLALGDLDGDVTRDAADLALEIAQARLARVIAHDRGERVVADAALLGRQPGRLDLAPHQILARDLDLVIRGVAGQFDHLDPIAQGAGDLVEHIGRTDEQHLGEIEVHGQVIVVEIVVLLRVEHLQQRRGRIAVHAGAELVELVQHEHGVALTRTAQPADDVAGQGTDIGPPMAADLGLVVHPAQRRAHERAPHGAGNALAQRGLADAGRAHEAQDRALAGRIELVHREVLQDAALDLVQAVVIGVEDRARGLDFQLLLGALVPGQLEQQIEVGAHHGIFARALGHARQALEFPPGLLVRLLRQLRLLERCLELAHFLGAALIFAQFLADGLHLLAQHRLALALVHALLRLLIDLLRELQDLDAVIEERLHRIQAGLQVDGFQHLLFLRAFEIHVAGDRIREQPRRRDRVHGIDEIVGRLLMHAQRLEGRLAQVGHARIDLLVAFLRLRFVDGLDARDGVFMAAEEAAHAEARTPLTDEMVLLVVAHDVAQDMGHGPHGAQLVRPRLLRRAVLLQQQPERALGPCRRLRGGHRGRSADVQRHHELGEDHDPAQRQDDGGVVRQCRLGFGVRARGGLVLLDVHAAPLLKRR